jgi:ribulose-phosphate 3-epimerase
MIGISRPPVEIAASLMCADFTKLSAQLSDLRESGVTRLHLDFADGAFVPNFLLGTEVFSLLEGHPGFAVESHLMIRRPLRLLDVFADRSDIVIVHVEAAPDPEEYIKVLRERGVRVGLAVSPRTSVQAIEPYVSLVDQVLVMTVTPGFAGGRFIPEMTDKIGRIRSIAEGLEIRLDIEADGGVNADTAAHLVRAGANVLVGGSTGLFTGGDIGASSRRLRLVAENALVSNDHAPQE